MWTCPDCKTENDDGALSCAGCGAACPERTVSPRNKKKPRPWLAGVAGLIVIIGITLFDRGSVLMNMLPKPEPAGGPAVSGTAGKPVSSTVSGSPEYLVDDGSQWVSWYDTAAGADADIVCADGTLTLTVNAPGEKSWSVQALCKGLSLEEGGMYNLKFKVEATKPVKLDVFVQQNYGNYDCYCTLGGLAADSMQRDYMKSFSMSTTDPNCVLAFSAGANDCCPYTVTVSKITLVKIA